MSRSFAHTYESNPEILLDRTYNIEEDYKKYI